MRSRAWILTTLAAIALMLPPMHARLSAQSSGTVVISQVYGGGGSSAALFTADFVELFNRGSEPAVLTGMSLQYATATGGGFFSTFVVPLSGTIAPGQYYLVRQTIGGANGAPLPTPDAIGNVNLSPTAGKVALVNSTAGLLCNGGGTPCSAAQLALIADLVGYGTANFFEGAAVTGLSTALAAVRALGGCADTNNNAADLSAAPPAPRNTASPLAPCTASTDPALDVPAVSAEAAQASPILLTAMVTPGINPPSTGLSVSADLGALGGLAAHPLFDDGVAPDEAAGDLLFTGSFVVNAALGAGTYSFTTTVEDAEGRAQSAAGTLTLTAPPPVFLPHDIQGTGARSPFTTGTPVAVRGVVTARTLNGFFLQTLPGMEDADPASSEGLLVVASGGAPVAAEVGRLVQVHGAVAELSPAGDPASPPVTALNGVTAIVDHGAATLPEPVMLTAAMVSPDGTLDQLENLEGMRVTAAALTAVSGTGGVIDETQASAASDGAFFAVLGGQARPFREPGIAVDQPALTCLLEICNIPVFDGNPERLRVDTDALEGLMPVDVSTGATLANVTGPLDFAARTYTILPEGPVSVSGGAVLTGAPAPAAGQFTVASFNVQRLFDAVDDGVGPVLTAEAYAVRLEKASRTVRDVLRAPDVVGLQDVENLAVLNDLAQRVDTDAVAAGEQAPNYAAILFEGGDPGGADVGLLVKTAGGRVELLSAEPAGADAVFANPTSAADELLFERAPVVARLALGAEGYRPQTLTVVVSHLPSLADVELDNGLGEAIRARRRAQADYLAGLIQSRQLNDPGEAVLAIGDYNAFPFNDGYADVVGTVMGMPAPDDQVVTASPDVVSPDLVDLGDALPAGQRYSHVSGGHAQALDHVLATANLTPQFVALVRPRVNADFPEALRGEASTPARLSDRDPVVAYFTFPADVDAPAFDTPLPNPSAQATAPSGVVVTFDVAATDAVDPDPQVSCTPASGSLFPVGDTTVSCTATDRSGNAAGAQFTVTVLAPASVPGHLFGAGEIRAKGGHAWFAFDVRESRRWHERGWVVVAIKSAHGWRYRYLAANVTNADFSDAPGYGPGWQPRSGVDTVVFSGRGYWNGRVHDFEVTATDRGEPGRNRDTFSVVITRLDGRVVESLSGTLRAGNIQSVR